MKKITFFAIPKAFEGHIGVIQRNALESWVKSGVASEVILFGADRGTAEAAEEFGFRHIPEVKTNEYGTPLVDDIFLQAQKQASHPLVCYINADIVITAEMNAVIQKIHFEEFLLVGRRWDLDVKKPVDFSHPGWEGVLLHEVERDGVLHSETGIDYFLFPRGLYQKIPPFAIGRTAWDNWLVYEARRQNVPVLDATRAFRAIHQNHGYSDTLVNGGNWKGPEAAKNLELAGDLDYCFNIADADWQWKNDAFQPRQVTLGRILREISHLPVLKEHLPVLGGLFRGITRGKNAIRCRVRKNRKNHLPA